MYFSTCILIICTSHGEDGDNDLHLLRGCDGEGLAGRKERVVERKRETRQAKTDGVGQVVGRVAKRSAAQPGNRQGKCRQKNLNDSSFRQVVGRVA